MDKKEQLIEYITQDIIVFLVEDYGIEYEEAMREFYASETNRCGNGFVLRKRSLCV